MVKLLAAVAVILTKLVTAPDGHEDVAEGEPVGDVEQHEGGGEHYPGYAVLTHNSINTALELSTDLREVTQCMSKVPTSALKINNLLIN